MYGFAPVKLGIVHASQLTPGTAWREDDEKPMPLNEEELQDNWQNFLQHQLCTTIGGISVPKVVPIARNRKGVLRCTRETE